MIPVCDIPGVAGYTRYVTEIDPSADDADTYTLFEDIDITACLDNTDTWQFNISNIRIPVVAQVCTDKMESKGWKNLGDGTGDYLNGMLNSWCDFIEAIMGLDYWLIGSYLNLASGNENDYKYYSDHGILSHEAAHFNQIIDRVDSVMNRSDDGMNVFRESIQLSQEDYRCTMDALRGGDKIVKKTLRDLMLNGVNIKKDYKQYEFPILDDYFIVNREIHFRDKSIIIGEEDFLADDKARENYKLIRLNMEAWAKTQTWFYGDHSDCEYEPWKLKNIVKTKIL
jgi:hypothetical protein